MNEKELPSVLSQRWKDLSKRSSAIQEMLWDLEKNFDDIENTKAYLVLDAVLKEIRDQEDFLFGLGVLD